MLPLHEHQCLLESSRTMEDEQRGGERVCRRSSVVSHEWAYRHVGRISRTAAVP